MNFLEINKRYILYVEIGEKQLTYVCEVLDVDDKFVKILDKNRKTIVISLDKIKSSREIVE